MHMSIILIESVIRGRRVYESFEHTEDFDAWLLGHKNNNGHHQHELTHARMFSIYHTHNS